MPSTMPEPITTAMRRLPAPHTMMTAEPTSSPAPNTASTSDACHPSPPNGLRRAMGKSAAADARESHSGDDVVSVMYHIAVKLAAQVANTYAARPHQITATVASQLRGSGAPRALVSVGSKARPGSCASAESAADDWRAGGRD